METGELYLAFGTPATVEDFAHSIQQLLESKRGFTSTKLQAATQFRLRVSLISARHAFNCPMCRQPQMSLKASYV